jgi:hypothetical protein
VGENSERVASWVEENDIAVGFGLRWWPHGAERDGAFLGVIKIGNVDIEVRLLRHRARRPSGRHVVLHPHRGQQETRELDNGNVFGGENNLPLETWTGGSDGSPVDAGISSWVPVDGSIRKANQASVSRFAGQTETQGSRPYAPTGFTRRDGSEKHNLILHAEYLRVRQRLYRRLRVSMRAPSRRPVGVTGRVPVGLSGNCVGERCSFSSERVISGPHKGGEYPQRQHDRDTKPTQAGDLGAVRTARPAPRPATLTERQKGAGQGLLHVSPGPPFGVGLGRQEPASLRHLVTDRDRPDPGPVGTFRVVVRHSRIRGRPRVAATRAV